MFRGLYDWTMRLATHRHAIRSMGLISFAESSFFPIPPDVMLVPMILARRDQAWLIATVCTLCSVAGGLLGHWAVWTRRAVELIDAIRDGVPTAELLARSAETTDANAALFDAANGFAGCIAGLHEILRRQGLLAGRWCLDPAEDLSPGQMEEIDRVIRDYPNLVDDDFVASNIDRWRR